MPTQSKLTIYLSLLLAAVISFLTLTPVSSPPLGSISYSDKVYHTLAFAALAFPMSFFRPSWLIVGVPVFAALSGIIEVIQPIVGRECDLVDWFADLIGIAFGIVAGRIAARGVNLIEGQIPVFKSR